MTFSRTSLANRALDLVGKQTLLDLDADTSDTAKTMRRNYDLVFMRCLRKAEWPWAIKRYALSPSATPPVNEFSHAFPLPSDCVKVLRVWPKSTFYKVEDGHILSDESSMTIKYISNETLSTPSKVDPLFADYFAHELAIAVVQKFTDSTTLRQLLQKDAKERYSEATGVFSQEDVNDPMVESPWIDDRDAGMYEEGTIRIAGLE